MPEITVAITSYNLERYLKLCFDDLAAQSFQDFEILVYDDCSTDHTRELLAQHQKQFDGRMQVILGTTPQRLPSKSRNILLESGKISGKYLVFLDGDDRMDPFFLERLYAAAERSQADMAICAYDRFEDESGHVLCQEMRGWPEELQLDRADTPSLALINTALWNKLIRTERVGGLRMPEFSVGEDASFLLALYMRCKKLAFVDHILIHYRVRSLSVISNTSEASICSFADELQRLYNRAEGRMKDQIALAALIHIGLSMAMRAYDNPQIDHKRIIRQIRGAFSEGYNWFRGNPYFRLSYLRRHGLKGIGLWCGLLCYRMNCVSFFLWAIDTAKGRLHMDFRF